MMWLTRPTPDDIERLARKLDGLPLSYEAGLLERVNDESELPHSLSGWFVDRFDAEIGHGGDDFTAARDALRRWQQFDRGWLVVYSLFAMSRPGRWFSWPGMPIARHAQAKFRPTSADAMRRAVAACRVSPPEHLNT